MLHRTSIAFFGKTNTGKSLLVNAVTAQDTSIVSEIKGTTTDPVKKVMELLPLGPVTIIDTPGLDDDSELGQDRIKKTEETLNGTQIAVLVCDARNCLSEKIFDEYELSLISSFKSRNIPFITVFNKSDLLSEADKSKKDNPSVRDGIFTSALKNENIGLLKNKIAQLHSSLTEAGNRPLAKDLVKPGSFVILVIPLDESAPKDRLILPQQMVLRELIEYGAYPLCCTPETLKEVLKKTEGNISLVITDSQAFKEVSENVPEEIPLTGFSILMARYKGSLEHSLKGVNTLDSLNDGDTILISEGCTHHRQCRDIGTVKLPSWIKSCSGKNISFEFSSGNTFPHNLEKYAAVVHCGGCMLNGNEMKSRIKKCLDQNIPVTNYGMVIAKAEGILERSLKPLKLN